ncbi:MAG: hypothetical protein ABI910_21920 [Gemmatimonadota bacterium]
MALRDVLSELEALEHAGIVPRFAIGGAVGATRYIEPAATEDVDVFISFPQSEDSPLAPLGSIYQFLTARGARAEGAHLVIGDWPVQFLPADNLLLAEALAAAREEDVDGVGTRVFTAEHLAAIALQLGRAKDKLRVVQFLEADALNMDVFTAILDRHGLTERWREFSRTILGDQ